MFSKNRKRNYLGKRFFFKRDFYQTFTKVEMNLFRNRKKVLFFQSSLGGIHLKIPFFLFYLVSFSPDDFLSFFQNEKVESVFHWSNSLQKKKKYFYDKKRKTFVAKNQNHSDYSLSLERNSIYFFSTLFRRNEKVALGIKRLKTLYTIFLMRLRKFFISHTGVYKKLKAKGFGRRGWRTRTFLFLRVGKSFTVRKTLGRALTLKIRRKQTVFKFFSNNSEKLSNYLKHILAVRPRNPYKDTGLRFYVGKGAIKKRRISSN